MQDTLTALHAAIIDAPTDRTARLVFADALDESGDPVHAARAEFIRAQIALAALPETDPERAVLVARCDDLFAEHWIDWWRPVCAAVGLPSPFVPKQRLRDRVKRLVRSERRPIGAPYTRSVDYPGACSISSDEYAFTAQFIGGFPEMLYLHLYTPGAGPELFARWASAIPLARLRFGPVFNDESGQIVDGPYLAKVAELTFDRLSARAAAIVAHSPHLKTLTALKALPLVPAIPDGVRALVHNPTWAGLRSLTLSGITPPDAIQMLAEHCTLMELEELSFGIGEVAQQLPTVGLTGVIGVMLSEMLTRFLSSHPLPPGPIRWPDYWPALAALARAPFLSRLLRLQVTSTNARDNDLASTILSSFQFETTAGDQAHPDSLFPDPLVRALADGLNPDRLVRLELPAARLAHASLAELIRRFGPRFVPV